MPVEQAVDADSLLAFIRQERVGGTYWASQPDLPRSYLLARCRSAAIAGSDLARGLPIVLWNPEERLALLNDDGRESTNFKVIVGDCDPWHMLQSAAAVVTTSDDELRLIAAICDVPVFLLDGTDGRLRPDQVKAEEILRISGLLEQGYINPFTGEAMSIREAIELCGFWRRLIDSNRDIAGGMGFAFWKQDNVAPLLWGGSSTFKFYRENSAIADRGPIAVWRSKASSGVLAELERSEVPLIEVEDGFLRSKGLGADCVPPLSIVADRLGIYFDPSSPSDLERLLQEATFDNELLARARALRRLIVDAGLGKYGGDRTSVERASSKRRHILVPGQVEDDRSVQTGGCGLVSNLGLLTRVREQAPDAFIIYKPHPDVVAGHRKGAISDRECLRYADEVATDASISSLIAVADEIHVNTSLAGFEALLRDKPVTTYGVPFYAGWGLTKDLGPVPERRSARRTIDELVAASLLVYPRYLDPVTRLPCPPEIAVARLSTGVGSGTGLVVALRRAQGQVMRYLRKLAL